MKEKFKAFMKGFWELLVIFAHAKFYFMCFMGMMLSLLCSMWILAEAGHDITRLANGIRWVGYSGLTCIAIIMFDKIFVGGKK